MTFNTTSIAEKIREDVERLIKLTSGEGDEKVTAYEIEDKLWWSLLALGFQLLTLFFLSQHQREVQHSVVEIDGASYTYVGPRKRTYWSIFGKLTVKRRAYWQSGRGCVYPLDAVLNLPQRQYSYRLQEWVSDWSSEGAYADVVAHLQTWLGLSIPKKSLQAMLSDHAAYHDRYEAQLSSPTPVAGDGRGRGAFVSPLVGQFGARMGGRRPTGPAIASPMVSPGRRVTGAAKDATPIPSRARRAVAGAGGLACRCGSRRPPPSGTCRDRRHQERIR